MRAPPSARLEPPPCVALAVAELAAPRNVPLGRLLVEGAAAVRARHQTRVLPNSDLLRKLVNQLFPIRESDGTHVGVDIALRLSTRDKSFDSPHPIDHRVDRGTQEALR